jgi:hypothetical protein
MRKILLNGTLANLPRNGGNTIFTLQFIVGLRRLGFDVLFLEHLTSEGCWDAQGTRCRFVDAVQRDYYAHIMTAFSLAGASSLLYNGGEQHWGASLSDVLRFAERSKKKSLYRSGSGVHAIMECGL